MKIFPISDVHTEFQSYLEELPEANVCVLAGDWCVAARLNQSKYGKKVKEFLQRLSDKYEYVIAIAGNHEYYHGVLAECDVILHEFCAQFPNVYFLQREFMVRDDIIWAGATLWTDFDNNNPIAKLQAEGAMTDYRVISTKDERGILHQLRAEDTYNIHQQDRAFLEWIGLQAQHQNVPMVTITHHAPSYKSCAPMFEGSALNPAFMSEMPEEFFRRSKLWFHGHIHWTTAYTHYDCPVFLNARGYPNEPVRFMPDMVIDISA